jgi:hypothetical protein
MRLLSSIIARVRGGWKGLWGVLVYVLRLRFLTLLGRLSRRKPTVGNGVGEIPPSSLSSLSTADDKKVSYFEHSITSEIQNTTHEWSCILASPNLSYHRHSKFKSVWKSATVTSLSETLMNIAMIDVSTTSRKEAGDPSFTVRFNHALSLEWTITKRKSDDGSLTFEKVLATVEPLYLDDEGGCPADIKNMTSLTQFIPVPRFAEATRQLISKHWKYSDDDDCSDMTVSYGNTFTWYFDFEGTFTDVYKCLVKQGMTFSSHTSRRRCFAELMHILCLHPDLNSLETSIDASAPVQIKGTLFGLEIDVHCKNGLEQYVLPHSRKVYKAYTSDSDRGEMEAINALPAISDFRKWITKQLRLTIGDGSGCDKGEVASVNKRYMSVRSGEASMSFEATVSSSSPTLRDNGALLRAWNCYLAKLEDDFERDRKTRAVSSLEVKADGVRLKTFALHVTLKHVEVEKTNPEFARYEERKRAVEEVMSKGGAKRGGNGDGDGDDNKKEGGGGSNNANEYALLQMVSNQPDRMITTVRTERVIDVDLINEFYRDISTVYLTERDEKNLMSCLYNFKHNRARLNRLGIPNKLGVMLNGPPGTGKTSMLTAIASYLEKDIYYLHLNELRTNGDLKDAFDHVFNKSAGGGMIVMEDVDAMTDIVKKRRPSPSAPSSPLSSSSCSNTSNEAAGGTLTLEFFLNLLQGSLTLDGSVFAATTNHLEALDPAFYRKGRFDVVLEMNAADHYQICKMYSQFFSRPVPPDLLQRIPEKKIVPAEFIGQFAQYLLRSDIASDEEILEPFFDK